MGTCIYLYCSYRNDGSFFLFVAYKEELYMFTINKYKYVDINTRNKFEIYSRTLEFADELVNKINMYTVFKLRPAKRSFLKHMMTDIPPYEIEQEQLKTIESWKKK